jgi:hypothetical protein
VDGNDLLHVLADEHRDLTQATRRLRQGRRNQAEDAVWRTAVRIAEHELAHRLLVHPLLRRDRYGRRLFGERREEQLLLADRIRWLLAHASETDEVIDLTTAQPRALRGLRSRQATPTGDPAAGLDLQFVEHSDREEILDFPHVRHLSSRDELLALVPPRRELREVVTAKLEDAPALLTSGRWATTARRDLPGLLALPDELVAVVPDLAPHRSPAAR